MIYRGLEEIADDLYGPPRVRSVWVGEVDGFGNVRRVWTAENAPFTDDD